MHGTTRGALGFGLLCVIASLLETRSGKSPAEVLRSWWVDPAVATLSFATAIAIFDRRERDMGCTGEGRDSSLRPFHIAPGSIAMLLAAGTLYWAGILLWVRLVPAVQGIPDGLPGGPRDALYLLLEVGSGIWAYDFIFSFVHLAFHIFGLESHNYHHVKKLDLRARDVLTHSPLDGALQVLVNILVQRHTMWGSPKSRLGRAIHNIVVTWMLTESHSASPTPYIARRFFVGARRHRAHHLGAPYYQQFFGYLDDFRLRVLLPKREHGGDLAEGPPRARPPAAAAAAAAAAAHPAPLSPPTPPRPTWRVRLGPGSGRATPKKCSVVDPPPPTSASGPTLQFIGGG